MILIKKFGENPSSEATKSSEQKPNVEKAISNTSGLKDRIRALNESGQHVQKSNESGDEKMHQKSPPAAAQPEVQSPSSSSISQEVPPFADRLASFANQSSSDPVESSERKKSPPATSHTKPIRKELAVPGSIVPEPSKPSEHVKKSLMPSKTSFDKNREPSVSKKSPRDEQFRKEHKASSLKFSHLSQQAREVAEALGSDAAEESDEEPEKEEEAADGSIRNQTVFNRVSMFETGDEEQQLETSVDSPMAGDMAAGWDLEKLARPEPGRIGGVPPKETKIDTASLDVGDIKNRWKQGNVAKDEKKTNSASEEALFRCYAAAATRTGGVYEIQQKMEHLAAGKPVPKNTPPKQSSKIAEIAESIHFDPNTMMPGAQHPSLNYNVVESTSRANE
ncbi:hypothetical protein GUITHDRAFT_138930 [Guillardia theta CCMP2712]|uniref:Uncharacterized protein n=1 Tax=Guillardia theta (strain CCMP2712) TaxID=905079 RepID=L1JB63_GUITC|nr:hypothetical protein GUITHDRAFT_138930 [Guillardia theta CCMP2712]EKX45349.1 hypothetical protein GUITHDRAFT_138930 [Guillardia theta CCMP2712]|eukprot:XP_005832329.1 hypothetical protein GUITHDRAFT_138930 [Guillardia theta CCMP2712]